MKNRDKMKVCLVSVMVLTAMMIPVSAEVTKKEEISPSSESSGVILPDDQQVPTSEELPDQVKEAMKKKLQSVEIEVSPKISRKFWIHYAESAPITALATNCGTDSSSYLQWNKFHWASFPVTYNISVTDARKQAVVNGFNTWDFQEHPQGAFFKQVSSGMSPKVSVKWRYYDGPGNVLAVTSVSYYSSNSVITSASVIFDSGDKWAVYPYESCSSQGTAFDVQNIATHEIGHVVGLAHVNAPALTMYAYASPGETKKRSLGTGDMKGIAIIYP